MAQAAQSDRPMRFLSGVIGRARPGTVRARLREWERFVKYVQTRRSGRHWALAETELIDYVLFRTSAGAPPSFPRAFLAAVHWMERRAGFSETENFGQCDALGRTVEWATGQLDAEVGRVRGT